MLLPQTMFWPSIVVDVEMFATCHHEPSGSVGLIALARVSAPAVLSAPAPCVSTSYGAPVASVIGNALTCSIALSALTGGAAPNLTRACSISSATLPLTTPAAMLVPLSFRCGRPLIVTRDSGYWRYNVCATSADDTSCWPGATTSGFAYASIHVGPREL